MIKLITYDIAFKMFYSPISLKDPMSIGLLLVGGLDRRSMVWWCDGINK